MNIEKINKLYENMISLQELFEEENAVDAINGLRFASAEFRHAFFTVRETLLKSPVGKQTQPQAQQTTEKNETDSEKESKSSKPTKKTAKKSTTTTTTKKKEKDLLTDKFDEFILDSYDETSRDDSPRVLTPIDEIIRMFSLAIDIKLNKQIYTKFRKYLRSIYTADGDKIYLKPKSSALPNECKLDASGLKFYQHPKFRYLWCREDGSFYYLLPDGQTLKENAIVKNPKAVYLSVIGGKCNHSARQIALECYIHRDVSGYHVSVSNGNKSDLSYRNLSISTMRGYKAPSVQYDESDAVLVCEYIVSHNKDIRNIESDTNYRIGYGFAKSILEKRRFERVANKYF